jgi:hypothetical protein
MHSYAPVSCCGLHFLYYLPLSLSFGPLPAKYTAFTTRQSVSMSGMNVVFGTVELVFFFSFYGLHMDRNSSHVKSLLALIGLLASFLALKVHGHAPLFGAWPFPPPLPQALACYNFLYVCKLGA